MTESPAQGGKVVILTGGVGGAKLALGMAHAGLDAEITAIVNTGDDFEHMGLRISPDIDTLLYTLSGKANAAQGWGREGETWSFMHAAKSLGAPDWFNLGDGDLALHVLRTQALRDDRSLSDITRRFAQSWGITMRVLPMTDQPLATIVHTDEGDLPFQSYFVEKRCAPIVRDISFMGEADAKPAKNVVAAITDPDNRAVIIAPSNPFLSIAPILSVPGIADALRQTDAPVVAVSPLVGGQAVKGPTSKIMTELGLAHDACAVAEFYGDIIDAMLVDERDDPSIALPEGIVVCHADTLMHSLADKVRVAKAALALADTMR